MTIDSCARYCQNYERCRAIIWALKAYERTHEEKHPMEKVFFSEQWQAHCHRPYPPGYHFRASGSGGTNS